MGCMLHRFVATAFEYRGKIKVGRVGHNYL